MLYILIFSVFIALFLVGNRTMIGVLALSIILIFFHRRESYKPLHLLFAVSGIAAFYLLINISDIFILSLQTGRWELDLFWESAILTRMPLYTQYLELFKSHWVFGVGFGYPVANVFYENAFYTDISILTFWLVMGLPGFMIILVYWLLCFKIINRFENDVKFYYMVIFFASIIISFNVDLVTRNYFVVLFSFMIAVNRGYSYRSKRSDFL
jgi:hypothetical protein